MTRIVFCDLDGTLLPAGRDRLSAETLAQIKRITDKGVYFCVASGRPYSQLKALFGELYRRVIFICLDGALTMHRDCVLAKRRLPYPERILSGDTRATLFCRGGETEMPAGQSAQNVISILNRAGGEALKIALYGRPYHGEGARLCYQSGDIYEYVAPCANKGSAAKTLMEKLRVSPEQAVALGDGENDIPLFREVGKAFRTPICHQSLCDMGFSPKNAEELLSEI